jgi:hypothetical protein
LRISVTRQKSDHRQEYQKSARLHLKRRPASAA